MLPRRSLVPWSVALAVVLVGLAIVVAGFRDSPPPPRPVPNQAFRSPPGDGVAELWAVGDGGDGGRAARRVARRIAAGQGDRLLYLGDVYPSGRPQDFERGFRSVYGSLRKRTSPTPGNHDWPNHDIGYDRYWRGVTGAPTPPWYAFAAGGWSVLSLNSEAPHGPASEQLRWLRRQTASGSDCRLAFWHRPRYSAGSHGDQRDIAPLWDALRGRAALVVNAHDHNLQRMRARDGMTQLVAGGGGKSHYELNAADDRLAFANDRVDGALRIVLRPGRADVAFVSAAGRTLDSARVRCRTRAT